MTKGTEIGLDKYDGMVITYGNREMVQGNQERNNRVGHTSQGQKCSSSLQTRNMFRTK